MTEFRLSERAEPDLIEIYSNTAETFGSYQAEVYHACLERTFDLLASFPRIVGRLRSHGVGHNRASGPR